MEGLQRWYGADNVDDDVGDNFVDDVDVGDDDFDDDDDDGDDDDDDDV